MKLLEELEGPGSIARTLHVETDEALSRFPHLQYGTSVCQHDVLAYIQAELAQLDRQVGVECLDMYPIQRVAGNTRRIERVGLGRRVLAQIVQRDKQALQVEPVRNLDRFVQALSCYESANERPRQRRMCRK